MNKDQSKKFTEIMFGSDLIEIQENIQAIEAVISKLDLEKSLLTQVPIPDEFISKLKNSKHTQNHVNNNFGNIIKNIYISSKIELFVKENKVFNLSVKTDIEKINNLFFEKEESIETYIRNKENEVFINATKKFNLLVNGIFEKIKKEKDYLTTKINQFNILILEFEEKKINHEKIADEECSAIKFVLINSKNECYVCKNKSFNPDSKLYKEWDSKINNKFLTIKVEISTFVVEINKMMSNYNSFIKDSESTFQKNKEVIEMNEKIKELKGIFKNINDSLEKNTLLEVIEEIKQIKTMEEVGVFKDNLFDILLQNFKEEIKNYLNIVILRNSAMTNKIKLKKDMDNFEPMKKDSFKLIKKTLKTLNFPYDIKLEKISGNVTDMGINSQKIIIDNNREVHELSAGEKNLLALSFFISIIYNKIKQKKDIKTIIIDDPVDSNDSGKIGLIIQEFRNIGNKLVQKEYKDIQWIYFTHNSEFLFASIDPLRSEKLKIINFYSSDPWFVEVEGKEDIASFLISNEKFLWNIIKKFIKNQNDETFIRAFCIFPKYIEIMQNLTGKKYPKEYKKILDYDNNKKESFSCFEFIKQINLVTGIVIKETNNKEDKPKDLNIKKVREFYRELDDWKPKDNYIEDLIEKNIRYIANATFYTLDESKDKNRINRNVLRHHGSAYKSIIFLDKNL